MISYIFITKGFYIKILNHFQIQFKKIYFLDQIRI